MGTPLELNPRVIHTQRPSRPVPMPNLNHVHFPHRLLWGLLVAMDTPPLLLPSCYLLLQSRHEPGHSVLDFELGVETVQLRDYVED